MVALLWLRVDGVQEFSLGRVDGGVEVSKQARNRPIDDLSRVFAGRAELAVSKTLAFSVQAALLQKRAQACIIITVENSITLPIAGDTRRNL